MTIHIHASLSSIDVDREIQMFDHSVLTPITSAYEMMTVAITCISAVFYPFMHKLYVVYSSFVFLYNICNRVIHSLPKRITTLFCLL